MRPQPSPSHFIASTDGLILEYNFQNTLREHQEAAQVKSGHQSPCFVDDRTPRAVALHRPWHRNVFPEDAGKATCIAATDQPNSTCQFLTFLPLLAASSPITL